MIFTTKMGFLGRVRKPAFLLGAALVLAACENVSNPLNGPEEPQLVQATTQNLKLRALPAPRSRVNVAVYGFPDLTGQYKERELVQTLSRAVSQGGSTVLIKALQDAGQRRWFSVLDRSSFQDLGRERQIVSEMRRQYRGETEIDPLAMAPLLHAGIILQGGIVGYDSNLQTGGLGARYLGIGGDAQWQVDTVTVSLRAVSSETGEVLTSVMTQKSIGSFALRGSVFRYVELDEILEIETGVTNNEPRLLALQQAVEKAVYAMIMEGAELGVWSFQDSTRQAAMIREYKAEQLGANANTLPAMARPQTAGAATITQTRPVDRSVKQETLTPATGLPQPPSDTDGDKPIG